MGLLAAAFSDVTKELPRSLVYGLPAALIASAALASSGAGRASRLARWGVMAGDASYALYLFHPFVSRTTRTAFGHTGLGTSLGPWAYVVTALAASLGVALISYRYFEKPFTRYVRGLLGAGGEKVSHGELGGEEPPFRARFGDSPVSAP